MTGGDRPDPGRGGRHLGQRLEQDLFGVWVRRVLQPDHLTATIVVADHAGETHHRADCVSGDQVLVFGEQNRKLRQRSPQDSRHRL